MLSRTSPVRHEIGIAAAAGVLSLGTLLFLSYGWPFVAERRQASISPAVALHAESRGGDLLVTWDVDSDLMRDATGAVLSIRDGGDSSEIKMDSHELRTGKLLYTPAASSTQFRLTVYAPLGLTVQHTLVAASQRSPIVEASARNVAPVRAVRRSPKTVR